MCFYIYNNRLIIDKNGIELLIQNGKFKYPFDGESARNLKKNIPKYRKQVRINQVVWDVITMNGGEYDGGTYSGNERE